MKHKLIITPCVGSFKEEKGLLRVSYNQWSANPYILEGHEFSDVIIHYTTGIPSDLLDWLHMHLGIRIDSITYKSTY